MRCFVTLSMLLAFCFASHTAIAQDCTPSCPPVEVTASTIDGGTATIPVFMMGGFHLGQAPNSTYMHPIDSTELDMTKEQVCKVLKANKPSNCSTSVYPPAPGVKSSSGASWAGNGCGAGSTDPLTTELVSFLYGKLNPNYSGNLNAPIKGRPDIDFTSVCDHHDAWYTSSLTKARADNLFGRALTSQCGDIGDSAGMADCNAAASEYQLAVDKKGQSSYEEDQTQYQCAAWGDSMKKDSCGSN